MTFKKLPAGSGTCFLKLGRRRAAAKAVISVAAALSLGRDGRISEARIAPGPVLPTPGRLRRAEGVLIGEQPTEKIFKRPGGMAVEKVFEITGQRLSTPYKKPVLASIIQQALSGAAERCEAP